MPRPGAEALEGWIPKPVNKIAIMRYVRSVGRPVTIGEIASAIGKTQACISGTLIVLVKEGRLQRHKQDWISSLMGWPGYGRRIKIWMYSIPDEDRI